MQVSIIQNINGPGWSVLSMKGYTIDEEDKNCLLLKNLDFEALKNTINELNHNNLPTITEENQELLQNKIQHPDETLPESEQGMIIEDPEDIT